MCKHFSNVTILDMKIGRSNLVELTRLGRSFHTFYKVAKIVAIFKEEKTNRPAVYLLVSMLPVFRKYLKKWSTFNYE